MEVDKIDGVQKFNGSDKGWVDVRLASMLFRDVAENVVCLDHVLLHPLVDGSLVFVKPLFK